MMTTLMGTVLIKAIRSLLLIQLILLGIWLVSFELFINAEVAFFSSLAVILGSMYSYYRLVNTRLQNEGASNDELLENIDDPYDLYDEESSDTEAVDVEEVDIKTMIREEKKRLRANTGKNVKSAAPAMVSFYRMIPYMLLVLGFIGLKNNNLLSLWPYLIGLGFGIVAGFFVGKQIFGLTPHGRAE